MVQRFSKVVDKQCRLISSMGIQRQGEKQLSLYKFRHILVQKYRYEGLAEAERVYLQEAVGQALAQKA